MKLHTFVTDTTDPRERGRLIGERFAPAIRETVALYLAFFPKLGIAPQRAGRSAKRVSPRSARGARASPPKSRRSPTASTCRAGSSRA